MRCSWVILLKLCNQVVRDSIMQRRGSSYRFRSKPTRCVKLESSSSNTESRSFQSKQYSHKRRKLLGSLCFFLLVLHRKKSLRFYNRSSDLVLLLRLKCVPPYGPGTSKPRDNLKSDSKLVIILGHPVKLNTRGL